MGGLACVCYGAAEFSRALCLESLKSNLEEVGTVRGSGWVSNWTKNQWQFPV